jgi:hypothetical protein
MTYKWDGAAEVGEPALDMRVQMIHPDPPGEDFAALQRQYEAAMAAKDYQRAIMLARRQQALPMGGDAGTRSAYDLRFEHLALSPGDYGQAAGVELQADGSSWAGGVLREYLTTVQQLESLSLAEQEEALRELNGFRDAINNVLRGIDPKLGSITGDSLLSHQAAVPLIQDALDRIQSGKAVNFRYSAPDVLWRAAIPRWRKWSCSRAVWLWALLISIGIVLAFLARSGLLAYVIAVTLAWYGTRRPRRPVGVGQRNSRAIQQSVRIEVAARDGARCCYCGSTEKLQFDHIIPYSAGGLATVDNIQLLCGPCNRRKGASLPMM